MKEKLHSLLVAIAALALPIHVINRSEAVASATRRGLIQL